MKRGTDWEGVLAIGLQRSDTSVARRPDEPIDSSVCFGLYRGNNVCPSRRERPRLGVAGEAYQARDASMVDVGTEPSFDFLHSDPRYADLLRRVGLPQ